MRTSVLAVGICASLVAVGGARADFTTLAKPYFTATKPGAWAKYEQTTTDPNGKTSVVHMTVARLENEGHGFWIEVRIDPKSGSKQKGRTIRYLLNSSFQPEKNPLDFVKYIDRVISQVDGRKAEEMPWEMLRPMMQGVLGFVDFGGDVTPKGTDTVDGRVCDRFRMSGSFEIKILFFHIKGTYVSDLWLSDGVPFGRVKEEDVVTDDKGKVTKTDWKLLGTGTGYVSRISGPIEKKEAPPKLPFGN
jgi:hypothetical protein